VGLTSPRSWENALITNHDQHPDIDQRSRLFVGLTRENLARVADSWPVSVKTPPGVTELLAESRRLFVGAAVSYDNFVASSLKALQAADLALKLRLGFDSEEKQTMGQLVNYEESHPVLDPETRRWYSNALYFRNKFSHPEHSIALPPGGAEPILRSCHERIVRLYTPEATTGQSISD